MGIRSKDTGTRSQDQRLPKRDVRVLDVQLSADISPKVNSYSLHPRDKASQVPPRHQDSWLSTSTEPQPEDIRGPPGHIPNLQRALHTRVSNRNNVLKALAGTTWGQQKETILMTYKAIGRSVANYGAPVWSTNASATSIGKIQIAQNEALRIATGSHKMSSIDHLHNETEMLTVKQHSDLLSAQYLVQCLDPDHACHNITTMDVSPRQMKHTLHTRHYPTVQPMLAATKKETLQAVHTEAVTRAINNQQPNRVLHNRPPPISLEEDTLRRPQRTIPSQLRSGHCRLLNSYQNRLKQTVDPRCPDCGVNPHDVLHLFNCTAHPNALSTMNLWDKPVESIRELSFLDPRNLD